MISITHTLIYTLGGQIYVLLLKINSTSLEWQSLNDELRKRSNKFQFLGIATMCNVSVQDFQGSGKNFKILLKYRKTTSPFNYKVHLLDQNSLNKYSSVFYTSLCHRKLF